MEQGGLNYDDPREALIERALNDRAFQFLMEREPDPLALDDISVDDGPTARDRTKSTARSREEAGMTRRRRDAEGTIITTPGGQKAVRMRVHGRRLQRTPQPGQTLDDVIEELRQLRQLGPRSVSYTVANCLDEFLVHGRTVRKWAPATTRSYASTINVHLRPKLGRRLLTDLRVRHVQRLIDDLIAGGHSGQHARHVKGVLRTAIAHGQRHELVDRNVASLAQVPSTAPGISVHRSLHSTAVASLRGT